CVGLETLDNKTQSTSRGTLDDTGSNSFICSDQNIVISNLRSEQGSGRCPTQSNRCICLRHHCGSDVSWNIVQSLERYPTSVRTPSAIRNVVIRSLANVVRR